MSAVFLDSSALVKRYVAELGTLWVNDLFAESAANVFFVSRLAWVEVISALSRRGRESGLSLDDVERAIRALRYDFDTQYQVVEVDDRVAETAGDLVRRHALRAFDAVQVASALRVQAALVARRSVDLIFATADDRLALAARGEALVSENPNDHP